MTDRTKLIYFLVLLSVVLVNVTTLLEWSPNYVSNDGVQYLSTAKNWLNGNGFYTNALMYTPHFQGYLPAPQTVWPPGYPFVLAMLGILGINLTTGGLIFNLLFHALASVMLLLVLKRLRVNTNYAIVCSLLFYAMAIPWNYTRGLMTEPLFTCTLLAVILTLPVPGRSRNLSWLLCGALIACSIYVRYSAVIYAAGVGLGILFFILTQNRGQWKVIISDCLRLTALIAIPLLAFLYLMYRTHALTGTIKRDAGSREPETINFVIRQWGSQISDLMGFAEGRIFPHEVGVVLFICTIVLVTSLVIYAGVMHLLDADQDTKGEQAGYSRIAGFVIIAHALLLFIYLSYTTLTNSPLEILGRYLYQVYPGIYALFCLLVYRLMSRVRNAETGRIPKLLKYSLTALVSIYVLGQANAASTPKKFFAEGIAVNKMLTLPVTDTTTLATYIDSCLEKYENGSIWSTHGQHLHFNTDKPTLTLAEIYTNQPPDFSKIQKQIENYDIKLMVFLDDGLKINAEYKQHIKEIKAWLVDTGHNAVPMQNNSVYSHTTVDVFQVNQQCD